MDDKLSARAKLIYERDKTSPLFLRTAAFYLLNNDPDTAISILESGREFFPNHPLSLILLSKAYNLKGDNGKTESYLKKANKILDDSLTYQHYKKNSISPKEKVRHLIHPGGTFLLILKNLKKPVKMKLTYL